MLKACQIAWVAVIAGLVLLAYVLRGPAEPEDARKALRIEPGGNVMIIRKDGPLGTQVFVRTRFIEVSEEDREAFGVEWDSFDEFELE